jgi:hypothetical protein
VNFQPYSDELLESFLNIDTVILAYTKRAKIAKAQRRSYWKMPADLLVYALSIASGRGAPLGKSLGAGRKIELLTFLTGKLYLEFGNHT